MRERNQLDAAMSAYQELATELQDTVDLIELGEAEGDDEVLADAEAKWPTMWPNCINLYKNSAGPTFVRMISKPYDVAKWLIMRPDCLNCIRIQPDQPS